MLTGQPDEVWELIIEFSNVEFIGDLVKDSFSRVESIDSLGGLGVV